MNARFKTCLLLSFGVTFLMSCLLFSVPDDLFSGQHRETSSLWSHITGKCLDGSMKGKQLDYLPAVQTTWDDWVEQHPETKVLRKEKEVRSSAYENYFKDPDRIGIFRSRWLTDRMPGKSLVHGINAGLHALAIEDAKLKPGQLLNVQTGELPVVVVRLPDGGVRAYVSRSRDRTLHFLIKDLSPVTGKQIRHGILEQVSAPMENSREQLSRRLWFAQHSGSPGAISSPTRKWRIETGGII